MLVETFGALVETLVQWWRHWCTGRDTAALANTLVHWLRHWCTDTGGLVETRWRHWIMVETLLQ